RIQMDELSSLGEDEKIVWFRASAGAVTVCYMNAALPASPCDICRNLPRVLPRDGRFAACYLWIVKGIDAMRRFGAAGRIRESCLHPYESCLLFGFRGRQFADELSVDEIPDRVNGSEIGAQPQYSPAVRNPRFHLVVNRDVRTPEPVDRL